MLSLSQRLGAGLLAGFLMAASTPATAQPRLKTGPLIERTRLPRPDLVERSLHPESVHWRVDYPQHPTIDDLADLRRRGARVAAALPDTALIVSGTREQLEASPDAMISRIRPIDKISPELDPAEESEAEIRSPEAGRLVVVEFHPDVPLSDALQVLSGEGVRMLDHPQLRPEHFLIEATSGQIDHLSVWDEVAYLFPGDSSMARGEPAHACFGALTQGGAVSQSIAAVGQGWAPGRVPAALNFAYGPLSAKLDANRVRAEIQRALNEWSRVVQIQWTQTADLAARRTLAFRFGRGLNGGPQPFDGPGRTLAYAYFPSPPNPEPLAGDLYFDDDENWQFGANTDVYSVVLHEVGHALGLGHGDVPGSVMYPYYRMVNSLTATDITAVRTLYAAVTDPAPAPPSPPVTTPPAPPTTPPAVPSPTPPPANPPPAPAADRIAPALRVTAPAQTTITTAAPTVQFTGTASDNIGVTAVTWDTSLAKWDSASGTTNWTAAVPVERGINVVILRARDAAGNQSWRTAVVIRR